MKERGNPALRRMDRWLGIPLIALLSLFRKRRTKEEHAADGMAPPSAAPVITLLKSSAIGDTVLLSAVIRDLRAGLPHCRLRLACGSSNAPLAHMVNGLEEVVVLPMSKPLQLWRMRRQLRSDVFVDLDSWPRINALIAFISDSNRTIGFRTIGQHRHGLYDCVVDHSSSLHEVDNYRRLVWPLIAATGVTIDPVPRPWLSIPDAPLVHQGEGDPARIIVFHMFAGGSQAGYKEWPGEHWAMLTRELVSRGFRVALSGGPADIERNRAFVELIGADAGISVLPVTGLAPLAAWLRRTAAVITVDTGIAHLAGAAGARTLVLYGPTAPQRWGALGPKVHHLKDEQTPWIQLGFEVTSGGKPVQLTVDQVREAVLTLSIAGDERESRHG